MYVVLPGDMSHLFSVGKIGYISAQGGMFMKRLCSTLVLSMIPWSAQAGERLHIVGSSTVYPLSAAVAETAARREHIPAPVIEANGTGAGIRLFCAGQGNAFPHVVNASRRMTPEERDDCKRNNVLSVTEVPIGLDGIALVQAKSAPALSLTALQLYRALAAQLPNPTGSGFVPNPTHTWKDVNPSLPDRPIVVLGPPSTSGTRDALIELIIESSCKKALTPVQLKLAGAACKTVRSDGPWVEAGENYNLTLQKVAMQPGALGVVGYTYAVQNRDRVAAAAIDGVLPNHETVASGKYPLSRRLYFYIKNSAIGVAPGLQEYVREFTSEDAFGEGGYLENKGLTPLTPAERKQVAADAAAYKEFSYDRADILKR